VFLQSWEYTRGARLKCRVHLNREKHSITLKQLLFLLTVSALGLVPMLAQDATQDTTLTITLTGSTTLVSGPDCLGASGEAAAASVMISQSSVPTASTSSSVTYRIPAGAASATVGSTTFTSTKPWTMKITLATAHDTLVLSGPGPLGSTIKVTSTLRKNSWTGAVLLHPAPFKPSPQSQTPSNSKLQYTSPLCATTILGVTGSISNGAATSDLPTDLDSDQ
jgi:hypothetical protein